LVVVGPAGRPDHHQQHCYHHAPKVKPEAATAVVVLLMMDVRTPETCCAVNKRQVINWRNCCILLVDLFELLVMLFLDVVYMHANNFMFFCFLLYLLANVQKGSLPSQH